MTKIKEGLYTYLKRKYKNLTREQLFYAIERLTLIQKEAIYFRHGKDLNGYFEIPIENRKKNCNNYYRALNNIEAIISGKKKELDIVLKYGKELVIQALPALSKDEKLLFLHRNGIELNERNPWPGDGKHDSFFCKKEKTIITKLSSYIENVLLKKQSIFVQIYGFESIKEAKYCISLLEEKYQIILYNRWGVNLNEINAFPRNDIKKSYEEYMVDYKEAIHELKQRKQEIDQRKKKQQVLKEERVTKQKAKYFNDFYKKYQDTLTALELETILNDLFAKQENLSPLFIEEYILKYLEQKEQQYQEKRDKIVL